VWPRSGSPLRLKGIEIIDMAIPIATFTSTTVFLSLSLSLVRGTNMTHNNTLLATALGMAVVSLLFAYVVHANDLTINAIICQPPIDGVSWVNMAAILVCLSAAIYLLGSLLPLVSHLVMTLVMFASIAYVVFMCVMGSIGPPDTQKHVQSLANTLVQLPMAWLRKTDEPIKHCYLL